MSFKNKLQSIFLDFFGQYAIEYIEYLKAETNLKMSSIKIYEYSLSMFSQKMYHVGVDLETISLDDILNFFSSLQNMKQENVKNVKKFLLYLKERGIIKHDLLLDYIQPIRYRKEKVPSYYHTTQKRKAITYEFTPTANRNRKTLRVPTEAPAKADLRNKFRCCCGGSAIRASSIALACGRS